MLPQKPDGQLESEIAPTQHCWSILADLQKAHLRLLGAIQNLAKTAGKPSVDKVEYSALRFRVSQASLARRIVFRAACDHLMHVASPSEQQTISRLCRADSDLGKQASEHVNRWTIEKVVREWQGYRGASQDMRGALLRQIELERTMLCPLLHKHGSNRRDEVRLIPIDEFIAQEAAAG